MKKIHAYFIVLAAAIAAFGAAIHVAAILGGPSWYAFFGAPPQVVASARDGSWLAPVSTMVIALLMGICALYACSALGLVRRLPLLRTGLAAIAAICLLRALVVVPLVFTHLQRLTLFDVVAALVWAVAGIGFAAGFLASKGGAALPRA